MDEPVGRDELAFRDVPRSCERLKLRLAAEHPNDREAYTAGKADFIEQVLARG